MQTVTMGRVTAKVRIENFRDLCKARLGEIPDDQVRSVVVSDALVDTRATRLLLPTGLIEQIGLIKIVSST